MNAIQLPVLPQIYASSSSGSCAGERATLVFYVPPHGLAAVLWDAGMVLGGERRCAVARELTKVSCQQWYL